MPLDRRSSGYDSKVALLGNTVDYAGTFPPASLPVQQALRNASSYRSASTHPWLLAKIALPLGELKKLSPKLVYELGADGEPWPFVALADTSAGPLLENIVSSVEFDLREIRHFNDRSMDSSCRQFIVAYETKITTGELDADPKEVSNTLCSVMKRFEQLAPSGIIPFFEVSLDGNWRNLCVAVVETLEEWVSSHHRMTVPGIKVRTGGKSIPTSEQIARCISLCVAHGLRFKATQGLHEAVSRGQSFGFVNLFVALALAQSQGHEAFGFDEVKRCLECTDKTAFRFGSESFSWHTHTLDVETIETARRRHGGCFGSCSLEEPDKSLGEAFGILPQQVT